jgi:hypothetical protein
MRWKSVPTKRSKADILLSQAPQPQCADLFLHGSEALIGRPSDEQLRQQLLTAAVTLIRSLVSVVTGPRFRKIGTQWRRRAKQR